MFGRRYECRQDSSGTWNVFDTFTRRVCCVGDRKIDRLSENDAVEIAEILNGSPQAAAVH
ncbi:hypothetical protein M8R20_15025 [Pseudomonas sp. R2.Fl]|nr:hypothetical protein [Pseudomonas sp. R2.Fl]